MYCFDHIRSPNRRRRAVTAVGAARAPGGEPI
jgi:hypothetical protein